jgi:hypothetical protein
LLVDEILEGGEHTVPWNGRDDRGHRVGSGIYFYRLEAGMFSAVRPIVVLH